MKEIMVFYFISLSINSLCQDTLQFKTIPLEPGAVSYIVQSTPDTLTTWSDNIVITPQRSKDTNVYNYVLSNPNLYYRVVSNMVSNKYFTAPLLYTASVLPIYLTNISLKSFSTYLILKFTSNNESNLSYYDIEQSVDGGKTFQSAVQVSPKGNSDYSITINRPSVSITTCGIKIFGWCILPKRTTIYNQVKEIISIYQINVDNKKILIDSMLEGQ